jgi:hypothetical protein
MVQLDLSLAELRSLVMLIPQTPVLFGHTLREALVGPDGALQDANEQGRQASEELLWRLLETVGMKDAVWSLAQRLETLIDDVRVGARQPRKACAPSRSAGALVAPFSDAACLPGCLGRGHLQCRRAAEALFGARAVSAVPCAALR